MGTKGLKTLICGVDGRSYKEQKDRVTKQEAKQDLNSDWLLVLGECFIK